MSENASSGMSRRKLLRVAGAVGAAASVGAAARGVFSPAIAGPAPKVKRETTTTRTEFDSPWRYHTDVRAVIKFWFLEGEIE